MPDSQSVTCTQPFWLDTVKSAGSNLRRIVRLCNSTPDHHLSVVADHHLPTSGKQRPPRLSSVAGLDHVCGSIEDDGVPLDMSRVTFEQNQLSYGIELRLKT